MFMRITVAGLLMYLSSMVNAQFLLENVNIDLIPQRSVRHYLRNQEEHNIEHFTDLHPSCNAKQDLSDFYFHKKEYLIRNNIETVWNAYSLACPVNSWEGRFISFGFMYSKLSDNVLYKDYSCNGPEEGQIIYVNLKLLKGIYNLATAFEIINIDYKNKTMQFSYLDGGKAKGIQTIKLESTEKGFTRVVHTTDYKSNSKFRDKFLYSYFHSKCINQFHHNIKKQLNRKRNIHLAYEN